MRPIKTLDIISSPIDRGTIFWYCSIVPRIIQGSKITNVLALCSFDPVIAGEWRLEIVAAAAFLPEI